MTSHDPPLEIERTFLLSGMPNLPAHATSVRIQQGYLPEDSGGPGERHEKRMEGRLRKKTFADGSILCTHAIKRGEGLVREEIQRDITETEFNDAWPRTVERRLHKTRHSVVEGELTWEIDKHDEVDLVLAEVELDHPEQDSPIPSWLQPLVVREVTDDAAYRNYEIALEAVKNMRISGASGE